MHVHSGFLILWAVLVLVAAIGLGVTISDWLERRQKK